MDPSDNFRAGMIVTSALIIWKGLMCITGSESPVVVVLSGSMEPGFKRVSNIKLEDMYQNNIKLEDGSKLLVD